MADKKLNEVTQVTDMAYVPVVLSDGSIGKIAKADLATVVAGLIGIATSMNVGLQNKTNAFTTEKVMINNSNPKTVTANGFLFIRHGWVWAGYELWWVSYNTAMKLSGTDYSIGVLVTPNSNNTITLSREDSEERYIDIMYQNIADI